MSNRKPPSRSKRKTPEQSNDTPAHAKVKFGVVEIEFEGAEDFVQRNLDKWIEPAANFGKRLQPQLESGGETLKQLSLFEPPTQATPVAGQSAVDSPAIPVQVKILEPVHTNAPLLSDNSASNVITGDLMNGNSTIHKSETEKVSLLQFYRKIAPQSQTDQVLVITYFGQKYDGLPHLTLDNYRDYYSELRRLAVDLPTNFNSSVRNAVNRTKFIFVEDGKFLLTIPGEEYVEAMRTK